MKDHRGLTLIELLIGISVFALIIIVVVGLAVTYFNNYTFSFEEYQAVGYTEQSITRMVREIREARISETGGWPIVQADDTTLVFYSDVTNDGRTDLVRYFMEGDILKKGVIEPTQSPVEYLSTNERFEIITNYVNNNSKPLFTYYNGDWPADKINNPLPQINRLLDTRYISIYLRLHVNLETNAQPFELTSSVQLRNLKDNL